MTKESQNKKIIPCLQQLNASLEAMRIQLDKTLLLIKARRVKNDKIKK